MPLSVVNTYTHTHARASVQVVKWHKVQQNRRSRETQARLNALKLQDYTSYLELAAQAKDSRLREVIHATEAVMEDLLLKVRLRMKSSRTHFEPFS